LFFAQLSMGFARDGRGVARSRRIWDEPRTIKLVS
jgi:hypothetical protein